VGYQQSNTKREVYSNKCLNKGEAEEEEDFKETIYDNHKCIECKSKLNPRLIEGKITNIRKINK
jgi:hypothetical protein